MQLKPSMEMVVKLDGGKLTFLGYNEANETLEAIFGVVINLNLLGVSNRNDLKLINELITPLIDAVFDLYVVLENLVLGLDEKEDS